MRRLTRMTISLALLAALAAVSAATVAAGGSATTTITGGGDAPPTAGEERELRVLLLQHGVTPVEFGSVDLIASLPGTDDSITVPATSIGDGEWVATVTFPTAGDWQLRIVHSQLATPAATSFAVAPPTATAWIPAAGAITAVLLFAVALIVVARRMNGGGATSELAGEVARAG
jgi:hypothetical protein